MIITDGGKMENVWFKNISAEDCITPIFLTLGRRSRKHTTGVPRPPIGTISNVKFSDFKATSAGPIASNLTGLNSQHLIKNVSLENIYIEYTKSGSAKNREINM